MRTTVEYKKIDYTTIVLYAAIVIFGWVNIYAACYNESHSAVFDFGVQHGRQLIWVFIAAFFALFIMFIEPRHISNLSYLIYGIAVFLLVLTLAVGKATNGGLSWIEVGSVKIQPSEFSKFATALALAKLVSGHDFDIKKKRSWWFIALLIGLPVGLIFLQHDVGSALVFLAFLIPFYRFGLTPLVFTVGIAAVVLFILSIAVTTKFWLIFALLVLIVLYLFVWIGRPTLKHYIYALVVFVGCTAFVISVDYMFGLLEEHQQNRVLVMLDPAHDPRGVGYNVTQSKIAIGSGGFSGKGFLRGTLTKANFVPEQETDFIFCTVGEEWGFVGGALLLLAYLWLLYRLVTMAERQASVFGKFYGYSVSAILFFHLVVNIGMVLGWMPVIGIPLPFFSYGGSSLLAFTVLLFIFIRQDASSTSLF
ncbi:MAG: rod shape-determining protein RodA [Bacteroidales bacterium]|nr:rod shape-determining protein RodA [Bacteroidales bacterium]